MNDTMCWLRVRLCSLAILSLVGMPGCATIIHGKNQTVSVSSTPQGADVLVDGQPRGKTPLKTDLRRGQSHVVEVTKPGYLSETVMTTTKLNPTPLLNAVIGGGVGIVVDLATGSATDVTPGGVSVNLAPQVATPSAVRPAAYVPTSDEGRVRLQ